MDKDKDNDMSRSRKEHPAPPHAADLSTLVIRKS
jgi:hypothetical protein